MLNDTKKTRRNLSLTFHAQKCACFGGNKLIILQKYFNTLLLISLLTLPLNSFLTVLP